MKAQLQRYASLVSGAGFPIEEQDLQEEELPFFKVADISAASGDGFLATPASSISRTTARRLRATVVPKGATVLPKIGAALFGNRRAMTTRPCCIDNNVVALVPLHGLCPRFGYYVLTTVDSAKFALPGPVPSLDLGALRQSRVSVPPLATQQVIADCLDRETTRIDALITAKRRMVELLDERWQEVLDTVIWTDVGSKTRVMHVVDPRRPVMYGIVLPGPDVGGDGIAIVKGGDVAQRRLSWAALCKTTPEIEAPYARARVRAGDLVFAIRGGIGDVAIVPDDLTGANLTQDVARVAPRKGVSSEWLMYVLQSPTTQHDVRRRVTGATITGLNIWELDRVEIPLASEGRQARDCGRLTGESEHHHAMRNALDRQIALLQEHRQAFIIAAVTGQLEIPEAA